MTTTEVADRERREKQRAEELIAFITDPQNGVVEQVAEGAYRKIRDINDEDLERFERSRVLQ